MSYTDYYSVLGVERDASTQEIQKRYRALAKKYHPDVSKEPDAEPRFKRIGEAYEVLKDEEKRRLYDKWGPHWRAIGEGRQPPPETPGFREAHFDFSNFGFGPNITSMDEIFEQVFGGRDPARHHRARRRRQARSSDHETTLELGVGEAYRGGRRDIQYLDSGRTRRLTVTVPAGVRHGQRIRLSGQAAGGAGDLFLKVAIVPDGRSRLVGDDVYVALRVSPHEAVLGTTATLETLDGSVKIKVPPGSSSGRQIRLRGRGYPSRGGKRGDLYAEIQIVVPAESSPEERALYEKLGMTSDFDPRTR